MTNFRARWRNAPLVLLMMLLTAPLTAVATRAAQAEENEETTEEAVAEEAPKKARPEFKQELVVVASHPGMPSEAVYSGREIERKSGEDIGYFLRTQNGVASSRRGPIGLDPQVRGLQETQVGVFVDGTRTFAAGPARMDSDLAHVSPRAVERMRVVKGPYALIWGAGAMSAISLETFKPTFAVGPLELSGRAGGAYGDNASASDGYLGLWGSNDRLRFQVLGQNRQGGDYEDGEGATIPGDYHSTDVRWSLGRRLGKRTLLEYTGGYQEQKDIDYAGRLLDSSFFYTRSHLFELSSSLRSSGLETVLARVYSNHKDHRMNNDQKPTARPATNRVPPFGLDVDLPTQSDTSGGSLQVSGARGDILWTAGLDGYRLEQTATRFISNRSNGTLLFTDLVWPDVEMEDLGGYLQVSTGRSGASLAATVRVDAVDASAQAASAFFLANTRGSLDQSETSLSAAVSSRFRLSAAWTLSAGLGRAVRTANALERYADRFPSSKFQIAAEFLGDPELRPEESLQFDLGAEYRSAKLSFQVETYYRTIDDYITIAPDPELNRRLPLSPQTVFRYLNGTGANFHGAEARLRHRLLDGWEWRARASYVRGEDEFFNEPVFALPPLSGEVGLRARPGERLWIDLSLNLIDDQDRVATARLERPTPGYGLIDLTAGMELPAGWHLTAGLENLADKQHVNHLNSLDPFTGERIPEPGRSLEVAAEIRF